MKPYELYARFPVVTDKGGKNQNIASLVSTVEDCGGAAVKVQEYGITPLARQPQNHKYTQRETWDVCLQINIEPTNVGDLKRLLGMRISELIRYIVVEKDEDDTGDSVDFQSTPPDVPPKPKTQMPVLTG